MMKIKNLPTVQIGLLLASLSPVVAFANEAGHEGAHAEASAHAQHAAHALEIPTSVTYQAINFLIYAALLIYVLRHPVRSFFKNREEAYKQALIKADSARRDAEAKKKEIQSRLQAFESSAEESLQKARSEAAALKSQIQKDASELANRLRDETKRSAELEIEKARALLREEMLSQSIQQAQKLLSDKIADGDQQRLQTEFVDKIQEVR